MNTIRKLLTTFTLSIAVVGSLSLPSVTQAQNQPIQGHQMPAPTPNMSNTDAAILFTPKKPQANAAPAANPSPINQQNTDSVTKTKGDTTREHIKGVNPLPFQQGQE